jgi:hypothetical protein
MKTVLCAAMGATIAVTSILLLRHAPAPVSPPATTAPAEAQHPATGYPADATSPPAAELAKLPHAYERFIETGDETKYRYRGSDRRVWVAFSMLMSGEPSFELTTELGRPNFDKAKGDEGNLIFCAKPDCSMLTYDDGNTGETKTVSPDPDTALGKALADFRAHAVHLN